MKPLKIFLVEDSEIVRENLIGFLTENVKVESIEFASNEDAGLAWLEKNTADVAIFDVMLGNGNGISTLKRAKEFKSGKWIVFSNHNLPELRRMCQEAGADEVFDKSNELESLILYLQRVSESL